MTTERRDNSDDPTRIGGTFQAGQLVCERYRVVRELGHGGMGEVYEAIDTELNETIVLKTVRQDAGMDSEGIGRLTQELQLARKVTHANVCRVYDFGRHSGPAGTTIFFTMELLDGETLSARLQREGTVDPASLSSICRQLAGAIDAAHERGIVHGDLKPGNVMFTSDGRVVITDFGLARMSAGFQGGSGAMASRIMGTPAYMAPEQLAGSRATAASDIYAFGILVHEMLTGRKPIEADGPVRSRLRSHRLAIEKALNADPSQRFKTASEFVAVLDSTPGARAQLQLGNLAASPYRFRWLAGLLVLAVLASGILYYWSSAQLPPLAERDSLLMADVANSSGESLFNSGLREGLALALQQSRYFILIPRTRAVEAARKLGKDPAHIDEGLSLAIARSQGIKVVALPSVFREGEEFRLTIKLVDSASGRVLLQRTGRAPQAEFYGLVDTLAKRLRQDIGESPKSIAETALGLTQLTTRSPQALAEYSRGEDASICFRRRMRVNVSSRTQI